ncbi:MAG: S1/P1 nuclease [Pseudomonadota bacterium]|nr:S1/P1 nuclease [Pseudomonadota bacterium]
MFIVASTLLGSTAWGWGAEGHRTVGALADKLLAGSAAAAQVDTLLGGVKLQDAAVWADCAKGVDPSKDFKYISAGKFPECQIFETPEGEAELADYVRRNDTNCARVAGDESCHKQYHYTDVAIQRHGYKLGTAGTHEFDIVGAIAAATHVLAGDPSPAPFDITSKREALFLLAHFLGDIHQPLHVGAVYLAPDGSVIDPDVGVFAPETSNRGGNDVVVFRRATTRRLGNLHQSWDDIPETLTPAHVDAAWVKLARATPRSSGSNVEWSKSWASETLTQARAAVQGLDFRPQQNFGATNLQWPLTLPYSYDPRMEPVKKRQLTKAGARLAALLKSIWP